MVSDWKIIPLGEFLTLQRGFDLPVQKRVSGTVPIVSSSGVSGFHAQAGAKGPGVVTGRYGTIGQVFFIKDDYWPLNTTLWVKDFKGNDPLFASYLLRTLDYASCSDKSSVPGVNRNDLHRVLVQVPNVAIQRAIASVLGTLDAKIELNRRMNETLEAMARALFQSWFVDFDPVRSKLDGRQPAGLDSATAKLFPSSFQQSAIGPIPSGWRTTALEDVAELQRGKTYKSELKGLPGPYLLGLASIGRNGGFRAHKLVTYGGDCPPALLVRPGDIFVSLKDVTQSADLLGAVARMPLHFSLGRLTQDTVRLKFKEGSPSRNIVYRSLLTEEYRAHCRAHATGTTNLGLARDDFLSYPVIVPAPAIQSRFDAWIDAVEEQIGVNEKQSRTLATLRDTLLPKLLSGELSVASAESKLEASA